MPRALVQWLVTTLAILMIPHLIGGVEVEGPGSALAAAAILGVLNLLVRPVLILLTLPLTLATLGFFLLVINALVFQLAGWIVSGLHVSSFGSAFLASLIVSVVSWVTQLSVARRDGRRVFVVQRWDTGRPGERDVTPRTPDDRLPH